MLRGHIFIRIIPARHWRTRHLLLAVLALLVRHLLLWVWVAVLIVLHWLLGLLGIAHVWPWTRSYSTLPCVRCSALALIPNKEISDEGNYESKPSEAANDTSRDRTCI